MKKEELLSFLSDGPWRNDACLGYARIGMERQGLDQKTIQAVLLEINRAFDDLAVEEAARRAYE